MWQVLDFLFSTVTRTAIVSIIFLTIVFVATILRPLEFTHNHKTTRDLLKRYVLKVSEQHLETHKRFEERNKLLTAGCQRVSATSIRKTIGRNVMVTQPNNVPSTLFSSLRHKLVGCLPWNTGAINWLKLLWRLDYPGIGTPNWSDKIKFWHYMENRPTFQYEEDSRFLYKSSNDSKFIKFLTARHPLSRLYAGWQDDMRIGAAEKLNEQSNFFRVDIGDYDLETNHTVTWQKYIDRFHNAVKSGNYKVDQSLQPIAFVCNVCQVKYDYVVHVESALEDSSFLLKDIVQSKLVLPLDKEQLEEEAVQAEHKHRPKGLRNFCGFSDDVIVALEEFYEGDYNLFGYEKFDRDLICS